ncbi:ABC transporter ATP-binding protein [Solirubrobacter soli]|uniref:ABC transporter ATP-binding protein n=1 Tax=Solirubrobacter soli TaxID=363832 RepID=UPI0003FBE7C0|nr:ATP-binding cassette domain-containing protein [Solirubrobacter soli]
MIEVEGLTKRYGETLAVDGLTFDVLPGQVTGFVGPNGSGKSTTMRVILGLDAPDAGTTRVGRRPYATLPHPLREVGALLDASAVHPGLKGVDHLRWLADSNAIAPARVREVLELVGLSSVAERRVGTYSLGMRQRLGIAAALLGDPPALLFDEPVNGLDPEGIRWIRGLLRSLAAEGRAVLVSSHLMSELEDTADHLIVIGRGRLIADTTMGEMLARGDGRVLVRSPDAQALMPLLAGAGGRVETDGDVLTVTGLPAPWIADLALKAGLRVHELSPRRTSLEDVFMDLTREAVEYR